MSLPIPDSLPAEFQDQIVALCAEFGTANMIHLFLGFPDRLDPARLARAARLMVDAEPILGCRLDAEGRQAVWRRHAEPDGIAWFENLPADGEESAIRAVLAEQEPAGGRLFRLRLHRGPAQDLLVVSVHHAVADGAAAFDCCYELASIYSRLAADPAYRPEPNPASRDSFEWMVDFTWRDRLRLILRDLGELRHARSTVYGLSGPSFEAWRALPRDRPAFVRRRIAPERVQALDAMAASRRCTRHDLLVAGLARAFPGFAGGRADRFRLLQPSNLRRLTPASRRPAIRNLSAVATVTLDPDPGTGFEATLDLVKREAQRLKWGYSGAPNPVASRLLASMSYARKRRMLESVMRTGFARPAPPTFTNVGLIDHRRLKFDGRSPDDVFLLTEAYPMPLFLLGAVQYQGAVTLSVAFQASDWPVQAIETLLDRILGEIPVLEPAEGCHAAIGNL
jgi:NRPS condensation-like uncharacterized protein